MPLVAFITTLGLLGEEGPLGLIAIGQSLWSGAGLTAPYTISNVPAGTFYIGAVVLHGEGIVPGDYLGYYGGSGLNPPAARNVTVNAGQAVTGINFTLATMP